MFKASEFKLREVINLTDGERLGYVCDLEIDDYTGKIYSLVVPSRDKNSFWGKTSRLCIPWSAIEKISDDIILVNFEKSFR